MPKRATYSPLFPDQPLTRVKAVRGTASKYFVSRRGNIYHQRDVVVINKPALRPGATPLKPDFGGNKGRARVELTSPKRRKRWHPDVLWLVARAWNYGQTRSRFSFNPLKGSPCEFYPKNRNPLDFRAENIDFRDTRERCIRRKWRAAQRRFNEKAEAAFRESVRSRRRRSL